VLLLPPGSRTPPYLAYFAPGFRRQARVSRADGCRSLVAPPQESEAATSRFTPSSVQALSDSHEIGPPEAPNCGFVHYRSPHASPSLCQSLANIRTSARPPNEPIFENFSTMGRYRTNRTPTPRALFHPLRFKQYQGLVGQHEKSERRPAPYSAGLITALASM
jgi:hypothetical protein